MKFRKAVLGVLAIIVLGCSLGGCVVVPGPYFYGHGGGYYHEHR